MSEHSHETAVLAYIPAARGVPADALQAIEADSDSPHCVADVLRPTMSCVWVSYEGRMQPVVQPEADTLNVLTVAKVSSGDCVRTEVEVHATVYAACVTQAMLRIHGFV